MSTKDLEASMRKSVEATQRNFNTIRTGRANASLLDRVSVEYYGADTPLKSLATLSTPDSQTIQIQPFDLSALASIEKAIAMSELGFTPNNDGINDVFRVEGEDLRGYWMKVFNRWGELVFATDDPEEPWLGQVGNDGLHYCPNGSYVYQVVYEDQLGYPRTAEGHVLLLR